MTKRSVGVDDISIACDDHPASSNVSRRPLLLLHGAVQTRAVWDAQVAALVGDRRLILPDLRGHGDTPSGTESMSLERLAKDALGLLDQLEIDGAIVCGVSLGGMVALEMAAARPSMVSALVLANTPRALSSHAWARRLVDRVDPHRLLRPTFRFLGQERTARYGLALAALLVGPHWVGGTARRHFIEGFSTMSEDAIVATYRAIVESRQEELSALTQPCLVIDGSRDAAVIAEQSDQIASQISDAQSATINAGHVANLDDPEAFNRVLATFLDLHG